MITNKKGKSGARDGAQFLIFLSWLVYTMSYLGKVNYSANITQIVDFYQITKSEAGIVPSFFFFSYGIGQVVNGLLCKKYNIKWMVFFSLFTSAVVNFIVGVTTNFDIIKWLWMINGFVLSILWPTLVRLLSESLPQKDLGRSSVVMGTTVAEGTLIIYALSAIFAAFSMFKWAFYVAAFIGAAVSVLWIWFYKKAVTQATNEKPSENVVAIPEEQKADERLDGKGSIYILVGVLCLYAIIVNLTKDGLTTWVPSILKEEFAINDSVSILLTLLLPIVAIFGSIGALILHNRISD